MNKNQCPGCDHDANLDAVLRSGYSDFHDHLDTCPVFIGCAAKVASDARFEARTLGRPKLGEKVFFWPEPDAYAELVAYTDAMSGR